MCGFLQSGPAGRGAVGVGGCLGRTRRVFAPVHSEGFSFRGGGRGGGPAGRSGPALTWPSLFGGDCRSIERRRLSWWSYDRLRPGQVPVSNADERKGRAFQKRKHLAAPAARPGITGVDASLTTAGHAAVSWTCRGCQDVAPLGPSSLLGPPGRRPRCRRNPVKTNKTRLSSETGPPGDRRLDLNGRVQVSTCGKKTI